MKYYYTDGQNKFGPMSVEKLLICDINAKTLVWCEGMTDWVEACEIAEIAEVLKSLPPPIPKNELQATIAAEEADVKAEERATPTPPLTPPKSWLVESILVTIFCCLPLGIVAIIFAWQVEDRYMSGDYDGALKLSNRAKSWCKYALIVGIVFWAIPLLLFLLLGIAFIPAIIAFFSTGFLM